MPDLIVGKVGAIASACISLILPRRARCNRLVSGMVNWRSLLQRLAGAFDLPAVAGASRRGLKSGKGARAAPAIDPSGRLRPPPRPCQDRSRTEDRTANHVAFEGDAGAVLRSIEDGWIVAQTIHYTVDER
jgi:hypothetical protein